MYQEHQLSAKQKGLEFCQEKDTNVIADYYSITQIFANLIDNAIKYTKEGKVEILLGKNRTGNTIVEIKDAGIGIRKEFLPKLFEPFTQEDHGFTRSFDGNGLGLALVKRIVELMKGYIQVESDVGKGSVFSIWLPAIPNQNQIQQQIEEKLTTTIVKPPTTKEKSLQKILVVENNSSNRILFNRSLSGFARIIEAEDGISGVTMASKVHFDLILIDINLGAGIDGVQAMHEIRKIPGYTCVPIIAVTAYVMFGDKEWFLSEGFYFYLAKPFMKDALVSLVEKTLAKVKK